MHVQITCSLRHRDPARSDQLHRLKLELPTELPSLHGNLRLHETPNLGVHQTGSSSAEAIAIANDTEFGLAAGLWTRDLHRALSCVNKLRAGTIWVNNYRSTSFTTQFGGYKRSGLGREGGVEAIKDYLQAKSVWITTKPNRANPFILG
ncbi:MAG: aldehyde dehydrogenase family protein [Xanthobacteraceae bacterium]